VRRCFKVLWEKKIMHISRPVLQADSESIEAYEDFLPFYCCIFIHSLGNSSCFWDILFHRVKKKRAFLAFITVFSFFGLISEYLEE